MNETQREAILIEVSRCEDERYRCTLQLRNLVPGQDNFMLQVESLRKTNNFYTLRIKELREGL